MTKRPYHSALRRENAEATRLRIAEVARTLMLARGYAATTMSAVAEAAGVAVQTLYSSCPGGKPGLAKLVYDVTLAGDAQDLPQSERPDVHAVIGEPDPGRKIDRYAAMAATIAQRVAPVHRVLRAAAAAAQADTGLHDLLTRTEQERRAGTRGFVGHLHAVGALGDTVPVDRAADQVYALTAPEIFERLTDVCGWTGEEYRTWLAGTLRATLLAPS